MKYIDADKLIAEIEKRQEARQDRRDSASLENEYWPEGEFSTRDDEDDAILSIIASLQQEQPEVDLEKEYKRFIDCDNGRSMYDCARHFAKWGATHLNDREMYLRFGDIPSDEKSRVWRGDELSGEENGVSVYDVIIGEDGKISVGFPLPATDSTLDTFIGFIKYQKRPMFLVDGDFIGRGSDNEPLIRNVKMIKEIKI